jgi:hypothetical protein
MNAYSPAHAFIERFIKKHPPERLVFKVINKKKQAGERENEVKKKLDSKPKQ